EKLSLKCCAVSPTPGAGNLEERRRCFGRCLHRPSEMQVGRRGCQAAARCPDDELLAKEIGFDFIAQGVDGKVHGGGQSLNSRWATFKHADQGFEVAAILLVEP